MGGDKERVDGGDKERVNGGDKERVNGGGFKKFRVVGNLIIPLYFRSRFIYKLFLFFMINKLENFFFL